MILDDVSQYKALIECNNVGKKLGNKSAYVFTTGMLMFYPYELHGEYSFYNDEKYYDEFDYQASIVFMHDDIIKQLDGLEALDLFIEGDLLAKADKDYGHKAFNHMEITKHSLDIHFNTTHTETEEEILIDWLRSKHDSSDDDEWLNAYEDDGGVTPSSLSPMERIDWVKYKNSYEAKTYDTTYVFSIKLLNKRNSIIVERYNKFKNEILSYNISEVYTSEMSKDLLVEIAETSYPYTLKSTISGKKVRTRVMKHNLVGFVASKILGGEYKCVNIGKELYLNIIIMRMKKFTISTAFKSTLY